MTIPARVEELQEDVQGLSETQLELLRVRAKNNLFFMSKGILGHKDVNLRTHGGFCRFVEDERWHRKLGLMPRLHLKTTIATEADPIRICVKTDGDARILIANEVVGNAEAMLGAIMGHFERNELLRTLFGHLIPDRFSGTGVMWSATKGIRLNRDRPYKEPSIMPLGVGGAATSKHFTHIYPDDLIGLEANRSPAEMKKAIDWNNNVESLIVGAHDTWILWIGTRWKKNDLYGHIIKKYGNRLKVFRRSIEENGKIIFPEKITQEQLDELKKTPHIFFAQYMNEPLSEEALDFSVEDLQEFRITSDGFVEFFENGKKATWPLSVLDKVITVDPNSGSPTAPAEASISVVAMAPDGKVFLLAQYAGRPNPTEFIEQVYRMARDWHPRIIGIEKAGQQNTKHYLKERMRKDGYFFLLEDLKPENTDKDQRIRTALHPLISMRLLYVQQRHRKFRAQVDDFPNSDLKDRIDGVAYAPRLLKKPWSAVELQKNEEEANKILAFRNKYTGW